MKTPREILFERHRQAEPRLNKVRRQALAELTAARSEAGLRQSRSEGLLKKIWLELIWPSRRAWAGMATLWLALLAVNFGMKATATSSTAGRSARSGELVRALEEQRRLLAELLPA